MVVGSLGFFRIGEVKRECFILPNYRKQWFGNSSFCILYYNEHFGASTCANLKSGSTPLIFSI